MAQAGVPPRLITLLASWGADRAVASAAAADVAGRYDEPHRRYHTREHIDEMLAVTERLHARDEVTLAVWFHDAVYDPTRDDNELRSGALARDVLRSLGAPPSVVDEVERLVRATAAHMADDADAGACGLSDADLAILGAPANRYERYRHDVRAEYAHVEDEGWRAGRAAVLRSFLARDRIFHDDDLRAELEDAARANLRRELAILSPP